MVTGFLGSGKTTLINYILKGDHGMKVGRRRGGRERLTPPTERTGAGRVGGGGGILLIVHPLGEAIPAAASGSPWESVPPFASPQKERREETRMGQGRQLPLFCVLWECTKGPTAEVNARSMSLPSCAIHAGVGR